MSETFKPLDLNDRALLISCPQVADCSGGLLAFDGSDVERIDSVSTTGLCLAENHIVRLLWAHNDPEAPGEFLAYDSRGVDRYIRIDELAEPHDITWTGKEFIVVSTATNQVLWVSGAGKVTSRWQAPGTGDAWHLNSLLLVEERVLACAFGRFERHRQWNQKDNTTGIVFDLATGQDVLTGLTFPHNPRMIDSQWTVCNSGTGELLEIDTATKEVRRRLPLGGWTRGVAVTDAHLFVGISARRHAGKQETLGQIAIICRKTWEVLGQVPIPCREVYDLVLVPRSLLPGLRRGFVRTHGAATSVPGYQFMQSLAHVEPAQGPQPPRVYGTAACRVKVNASLPRVLTADTEMQLDCDIQNLGNEVLASANPNPVHLSYKWIDPSSNLWIQAWEGVRTTLPRSLGPQQKVSCTLRITAPPQAGNYNLRITAVREGVAWFDDLDLANGSTEAVKVVAPAAAVAAPSGNAAA